MSEDDDHKQIKEKLGYRLPTNYYKRKKRIDFSKATDDELDMWLGDDKFFDLPLTINFYKNQIIEFLNSKGIPELHPTHNIVSIDKEARIYINKNLCPEAKCILSEPWTPEGYIRLKKHFTKYEERRGYIYNDGTIQVGSWIAGEVLKHHFSHIDGVYAAGKSLNDFRMAEGAVKGNDLNGAVVFAISAMAHMSQLSELVYLDDYLNHHKQHGNKENKKARAYAAKRWIELEQKIGIEKRGNITKITAIIFDELCELSKNKRGFQPPAKSTFDGWFKGKKREETLTYYKGSE